jgi:hypothetical protein
MPSAPTFDGEPTPMAENESLDLDDPYGRRWDIVFQSIRKNEPFEKVVQRVRRAMYRGLRNALKQFEEYGVTLQTLLDNRNSPQTLREFVRKTQGHEYLQLFAAAAAASSNLDAESLLRGFVGAVWDAAGDRIAFKVVTSDGPTSLNGMRDYLTRVAGQVQPDVDRIARKLADDPSWKLRMPAGTSDQQADSTEEMLPMSLLRNS